MNVVLFKINRVKMKFWNLVQTQSRVVDQEYVLTFCLALQVSNAKIIFPKENIKLLKYYLMK